MFLDFCKRTGWRILNGRIESDKSVGKFTCHTHRGQSLVDYVLASTGILQLFCYFDIGDPNILSDHSIVQFALLSTYFTESNSADDEDTESMNYRYVWDSNLREEYKRRIEASDTVNIFDRTRALINSENVTVTDIDAGLGLIVNGTKNCTLPLFSRPCGSAKEIAAGFTEIKLLWLDDNCRIKRRECYRFLNISR